MTTDRESLIRRIEGFPDEIAAAVAPLSDEERTTRYLPEEWTIAQIVHHCADSHMNSYIRCKLIATEENPPLKPYDEPAWATLPDATLPDVEATLAILRGLHQRWGYFFRSLDEADWHRTGVHPDSGTVTLDDQLRLYVEHGDVHLAQMQRVLAAR